MSNLESIQKEIEELKEKYLLASTKHWEYQTKVFEASAEVDEYNDKIAELEEKKESLLLSAEITPNNLREFQIVFKSLVNILENPDISTISFTFQEIRGRFSILEPSINICYINNELHYDVKLFTNRQNIFEKIKSYIQIPEYTNIDRTEFFGLHTWRYSKKEYPTTKFFKEICFHSNSF